MHHFILIQIDSELEEKVKVNLTQEEINTNYSGELEQEVQGKLFHVLAQLLKTISGIDRITIPGEFRSAKYPKA